MISAVSRRVTTHRTYVGVCVPALRRRCAGPSRGPQGAPLVSLRVLAGEESTVAVSSRAGGAERPLSAARTGVKIHCALSVRSDVGRRHRAAETQRRSSSSARMRSEATRRRVLVAVVVATAGCFPGAAEGVTLARTGFEEPRSSGRAATTLGDSAQYLPCSRGAGEVGFATNYTERDGEPVEPAEPWNSSQYFYTAAYTDVRPESNGRKHWAAARAWCRQHGADLVVIQDAAKAAEVQACAPPFPACMLWPSSAHYPVAVSPALCLYVYSRCVCVMRFLARATTRYAKAFGLDNVHGAHDVMWVGSTWCGGEVENCSWVDGSPWTIDVPQELVTNQDYRAAIHGEQGITALPKLTARLGICESIVTTDVPPHMTRPGILLRQWEDIQVPSSQTWFNEGSNRWSAGADQSGLGWDVESFLVATMTDPDYSIGSVNTELMVHRAETPFNQGSDLLTELVGSFIPALDGPHVFKISADDVGGLYFGNTEEQATLIATCLRTDSVRDYDHAGYTDFQHSAPQTLVAGRRYFIRAC